MTETFIAHVNGSHACYVTRTGVDRAFIGCSHDTPREAIDRTTRKEDTDALHLDRAGLALVDPTSRSWPNRMTPSPDGVEDSGSAKNKAPGSPRRPAPTGSTPPVPVGAPNLGLVPW